MAFVTNIPTLFAVSIAMAGASYANNPAPWAYPVAAPGYAPPSDDGRMQHVPNSVVAMTRRQINTLGSAVPDWHPEEHPAMPAVVAVGRRPNVWACGFCHLPSGAGRPENASLAGLSPAYIKAQVLGFRSGNRPGSEPGRQPQAFMVSIARAVTDGEVDEAAAYFASIRPESFIRVVESASVPQNFVAGSMLARVPGGGMEPLGMRIIEMPDDLERAENRDSRVTYVAYVPEGSLRRGAEIALTGGGKTLICSSCHGPQLKGVADVPRIAGRSPSYLLRQLIDIKQGKRTGSSLPMQAVVANLGLDDMVALAAYAASREP